jgi:hypothetical protein
VICGALKYFKWSAHQKSLGTTGLDVYSPVCNVGQEVEGLSQEDRGLVQVEDADVKPRAVNKWSHLFSQRPRRVTQMNSGLK